MTVERPTFSRTLVRIGYGRAQVDAAVDRIVSGFSGTGPALRASDVESMSFPGAMYRPGYDMGQVDAWLDEVLVALGGQVRQAPPVGPVPTAAPTPEPRNDWVLALTFITITLVVAGLLYVSRF
jgi:DivIVA domain-containing protein